MTYFAGIHLHNNNPPICALDTCNNEVSKTARGNKWKLHCSNLCKNTHNSIKGAEKRKQTCIAKFGHITNLQSEETKDKIKQTCMEHYGSEHHMSSDAVKSKIRTTCLEKYGVDNPSKLEDLKEIKSKKMKDNFQDSGNEILAKRKHTNLVRHGNETFTNRNKAIFTNLERYGVENPATLDQFIQKQKDTFATKYGGHPNSLHISKETKQKLNDRNWLYDNRNRTLTDIASELNITYYTVSYYYEQHDIEKPFSSYSVSSTETEIYNYVNSLISAEQSNRTILAGKEIDIYVPSMKLGFEIDGLYWHGEKFKDKNYHIDKTRLANDNNVNLIHITDYEWNTNRILVESRIKSILQLNERIFARKCKVSMVLADTAKMFYNNNHIQKWCVSSVNIGLTFDNTLVAVMSFSKSRFDKTYQWELTRYCSVTGHNVVGGASKLLAHFVREYRPGSIISYCDLRWNAGNVYTAIGFTYKRTNGPNYWYVKCGSTFENRINYQKHKLENLLEHFDPNQTEYENMINNRYDRYWDCGNDVWVWENNTFDILNE